MTEQEQKLRAAFENKALTVLVTLSDEVGALGVCAKDNLPMLFSQLDKARELLARVLKETVPNTPTPAIHKDIRLYLGIMPSPTPNV